MGFKGLKQRLSGSTEHENKARLQARFTDVSVTKIAETPSRAPARICGEVTAIQIVPRAGSPWLEVTVDDGSARAVAVFSGRKRIAGVQPGRGIVLEGVAGEAHGRLQLLNPAYTLL